MDTVIGTITAATTAITAQIVSVEATTQEVSDLRVLLIPLVGSMIMSGGAIMLNPQPETRQIIIGRAIIGLLFGAAGPSVITILCPSLEHLSRFPALMLMSGGLISAFFYVLSKPFFSHLYSRADSIAQREVERLESHLHGDNHRDPSPPKKHP